MIIASLLGGLGNQMFQYATARALSIDRHQPMRLDTSAFEDTRMHQGFELRKVFGCAAPLASGADLRSVLGYPSSYRFRRMLARKNLLWMRPKALVVEPHFQHWAGIASVAERCVLMGYWQSEKYFASAASAIRRDFTFATAPSSRNAALQAEIASCNAVSLHIRRGDYVQNARALATHGLCPPDYYRAAIRHFVDRIESPRFFVFSDDIPWVSENLHIAAAHVYVDHNQGPESYNDMRLMSHCRHHVIANSSFSWWSAWLNARPDKIVVAPSRWFADTTKDTQDLLPASWLRI